MSCDAVNMAGVHKWSVLVVSLLSLIVLQVYAASDYIIDDGAGLGRRFDGIGGLSGGGATSKLLVNYPEPQKTQILDYLFKPNFGASLQILKVEIGGDSQSTDGTESSHMHEENDENYQRGYEWWLMVEAKKRNPDIKLYALSWAWPGWIGEGTQNPYINPNKTAGYIIKWLQGAKKYYGLTIDYIGIWNEKWFSSDYIKTLRTQLNANNLTHIQIVAADGKWPDITKAILADAELAAVVDYIGPQWVKGKHMSWNERQYNINYNLVLRAALDSNGFSNVQMVTADGGWSVSKDILKNVTFGNTVDIIGVHYPGTKTTQEALQTNKTLWASEDDSTFNDNVGAGCWARILNQNYVNGYMTSTISWNLIAAYYNALPFQRSGLMTAVEPWSGHYVVETPIWVSAHTTQFTEIGWNYLQHGYGVGLLNKGGSYVSLLSSDKQDFTLIIETMSHDHSKCVRPGLPAYTVKPQNITFTLKGTLKNIGSLIVWHSTLGFNGDETVMMKQEAPIQVVNGTFSVYVDVDEVFTLTTVNIGRKGSFPDPPASKPFPLPYKDDFEAYAVNSEAYNFVPQIGVWEVRDSGDPNHKLVNTQVVTHRPVDWCQSNPVIDKHNITINVGGDYNWTDVKVSIDINMPGGANGSHGVFVGVRTYMEKGSCKMQDTKGIYVVMDPSTFLFGLATDMDLDNLVVQSAMSIPYGAWCTLILQIKGKTVTAYLNGIHKIGMDLDDIPPNGFVSYGTTEYGVVYFDNIEITSA